jgi:D-alanine-D-alanine ligase-like ATP-grasp enzyme
MIDLSRHPMLLRIYLCLRRMRAALPARWRPVGQQVEHYRATFYERLWQDAAARAGAACVRLGYGIQEIRRGAAKLRVVDNCSPIDDPLTLKVALNKALVYKLLAQEGLPIPRHVTFTLRDIGKAVAFLEAARAACVVKPADGTAGGNGITTGIRTSSQLARAAVAAAAYGNELLLEEEVAGSNYRLLYLDGVFLDAVLRHPPAVTGDGRSTVRQLVDAANAARLAQGPVLPQLLITIDMDMRNTLAKQGYSLRSIPPSGAVVPLKTVINQGIGNDNARANPLVCASIIADGARAARAVGTRLAGIDVITTDPGVPLGESGGVILEVNATPGYHHHYTRDGIFSVADLVLDKLQGQHSFRETEPACRRVC